MSIDLSDRTADAPVGSTITWHCYGTVYATATVVTYCQGIYGAAGVILRAPDGHDSVHVSGLPRGWQLEDTRS